MLMYGFQPHSPMALGLGMERIHQAKEFLYDHMDMLQLARLHIRQA